MYGYFNHELINLRSERNLCTILDLILLMNKGQCQSSRGGLGGKRTTMFTQVVTYMNLWWIQSRLDTKKIKILLFEKAFSVLLFYKCQVVQFHQQQASCSQLYLLIL